jgi:hypothetical protein
MPLQRAPHHSGVHRVAAIALYRALLTQCAAIPLSSLRLDEIRNIIRNRFRAQRYTISRRHLHVYFDAGYEALDHLDAAKAGVHESTSYLDALVERAPFWMKRSPKIVQKEEHGKPKHRPLTPIDLRALQRWTPSQIYEQVYVGAIPADAQLQDFYSKRTLQGKKAARVRVIEPKEQEVAPPSFDAVFGRLLPPNRLKGKRRVPQLMSANTIPILRMDKPQPPALSGYITHRVKIRHARTERMQRLQQEKVLSVAEDRWDSLMAGLPQSEHHLKTGRLARSTGDDMEHTSDSAPSSISRNNDEPSWTSTIVETFQSEERSVKRERAKNSLIGMKMNLVFEAEQAALHFEIAMAKKEKRDQQFKRWLERRLQRQKSSSEDSANEALAVVPSDEVAAVPHSAPAPAQPSHDTTQLPRSSPDTVGDVRQLEDRPLTETLSKSSPSMTFRPTRPLQTHHDFGRDSMSETHMKEDVEAISDVEQDSYSQAHVREDVEVGPLPRRLVTRPTESDILTFRNEYNRTIPAQHRRTMMDKSQALKRVEELVDGLITRIMQEVAEAEREFEHLGTLMKRQALIQSEIYQSLASQKPAEAGDGSVPSVPAVGQALLQIKLDERLRQRRAIQKEIHVSSVKCERFAGLQQRITWLMRQRQEVVRLQQDIKSWEDQNIFKSIKMHGPMQSIPASELIEQASNYGSSEVPSYNQEIWLDKREDVTISDAFQSPTSILGPGYFRAMGETLAALKEVASQEAAHTENLGDVHELYLALADVLRNADFTGLKGGKATDTRLERLAMEAGVTVGESPETTANGRKMPRPKKFMTGWKRKNLMKKDARITAAIEMTKSLRAFRKVDVAEFTLEGIALDPNLGRTRLSLFADDEDDDLGKEEDDKDGEKAKENRKSEVGSEEVHEHNLVTPPADTSIDLDPLMRLKPNSNSEEEEEERKSNVRGEYKFDKRNLKVTTWRHLRPRWLGGHRL